MYITWFLLGITILVSIRAFQDETLKRKLMFSPYLLVHEKEWYRVISHAFVHANWIHLIFNMYVLYAFGIQVTYEMYPPSMYRDVSYSLEPVLIHNHGPKGYLYFGSLYLGGILFSTLISIRRHRDNPMYFSLGASGATMSVLFGYMLLHPSAQLSLFFIPIAIPAYIFAPAILAMEYYMSRRGGSFIAHDAHFAGAVFGIVFMTIIDYHYLIDFFKHFGE